MKMALIVGLVAVLFGAYLENQSTKSYVPSDMGAVAIGVGLGFLIGVYAWD